MTVKGSVWITREIFDHWLWRKSKPFSMNAAWIDMILMASHKEERIPFKGKITVIPRGSFIRSQRQLATRWGWTRASVQRFLDLIEIDAMIDRKSIQTSSQINICNYDRYQILRSKNDPLVIHQRSTSDPIQECKEEYKGYYHTPMSTESPPVDSPPKSKKPDPTPHQKIIALYHEILPELSQVHEDKWAGSVSEGDLRARWRENPKRQSIEFWRRYFEYVRKCPFLMGETGSNNGHKPFRADLRWLVRRNNFIKTCEGKYER